MPFTLVQAKSKAAVAASVSIGSGDGWATPTAGNLLVAFSSSDGTNTINNSMTAGPSIVDTNAAYCWWKVAAGTESTITVTPNASTDTAIVVMEYSGNLASPFDVQNSSTIVNTSGTTTTSTAVTTTVTGDLVVMAACIGGVASLNDPMGTGVSFTNSFVTTAAEVRSATDTSVRRVPPQLICAAALVVGAPGSYSSVASWTNAMLNRQMLAIAFKVGATATGPTIFRRRPHNGLYLR